MDKYAVKLYSKAAADLDRIYLYISMELLAPGAAEDTIDALEQAIFSLEGLPERGSLRKIGVYKGYRQLFVQNFIIIYKVLPQKKQVHVVTVKYVKSRF